MGDDLFGSTWVNCVFSGVLFPVVFFFSELLYPSVFVQDVDGAFRVLQLGITLATFLLPVA